MTEPYKHWITPGVYDTWQNPSLETTKPLSDHSNELYKPGDKVVCIKTYRSCVYPEEIFQVEGEVFTVRAYLKGYEYLILEELSIGLVNCERFKVL